MKTYDVKASFAAGELAPVLHARVDMAQYAVGAKTLRNFIVLPQGGLINRPGTRIISEEKYGEVKLVPFERSSDNAYCFVFSDMKVDVYDTEHKITSFDSVYNDRQVPEIRWLQSNDSLFVFHPEHPVQRIRTVTRIPIPVYVMEPFVLDMGPFREVNTNTEYKMWVANEVGQWHLHSTWDFFKEAWIGDLVRLEQKVKSQSAKEEMVSGTPVYMMYVYGPFNWRTTGKWTGTIKVERCVLDNWKDKPEASWIWEDFKTYVSKSGAEENFGFSGAVTEYAVHYRFTFTADASTKPTLAWDFEGGIIERVFKITGYVDMGNAIVIPMDGINKPVDETDAWALGAFSALHGYPALGIFHQERLVLARTKDDPQTIWMSQPAAYNNFDTSIPTKDTDSIMVTLASRKLDVITGLASRGDLLIFTTGAEWVAKAGQKSDVFTPSSIVITPSGYHGSENLDPLEVGPVTLFPMRYGKAVRATGYTLEADGYTSSDMSILSSHYLENNPVRFWDYQQSPWGIVWMVLRGGHLLAVTLQHEHQVNAWTRQEMPDAFFRDVCCIPGSGQDEVFFAVANESGVDIHVLKHRNTGPEIPFIEHDGTPVKSWLETLDWEIGANSTVQARHKQMPVVTFRLLYTDSLSAGIVTETSKDIDPLVFPVQPFADPRELTFTGDARLVIPGGVARLCNVRVEHDTAGPVTILGLFPEVVIPDGSGS